MGSNMTCNEWYKAQYDKQQGCCAICREQMDNLCLDHSHWTGGCRGLLCTQCNLTLGRVECLFERLYFDDMSIIAASSLLGYLQSWDYRCQWNKNIKVDSFDDSVSDVEWNGGFLSLARLDGRNTTPTTQRGWDKINIINSAPRYYRGWKQAKTL